MKTEKLQKNYAIHLIVFIILVALLASSCGTHCSKIKWEKRRYVNTDTKEIKKHYKTKTLKYYDRKIQKNYEAIV